MLGRSKIRLDPDLLTRARHRAEQLGHASVEDYVTRLLQRDLQQDKTPEAANKQKVLEKMKGLGYIE